MEIIKAAAMMFKIAFDSYLYEDTLDEKLLHYLAGMR